jgi:hypothetical protein
MLMILPSLTVRNGITTRCVSRFDYLVYVAHTYPAGMVRSFASEAHRILTTRTGHWWAQA